MAFHLAQLILALACCVTDGRVLRDAHDSCDVIEVNHYVGISGDVVLDQVIFWEHSPGLGKMVVRDWRSLKSPHQLPYRVSPHQYRACWHDSRDSGNALRVVSARSVVETWTTFDPEQVNQELVDRNARRGLFPIEHKGKP